MQCGKKRINQEAGRRGSDISTTVKRVPRLEPRGQQAWRRLQPGEVIWGKERRARDYLLGLGKVTARYLTDLLSDCFLKKH